MAGPNSAFDRVATGYDRGMAPLERLGLTEMRRQLLARARGQILEIGIGTGTSLYNYPVHGCVLGLDESSEMLAATAARARSDGLPSAFLLRLRDDMPLWGSRISTVTLDPLRLPTSPARPGDRHPKAAMTAP